jgi:syntaxin-binding protein 1
MSASLINLAKERLVNELLTVVRRGGDVEKGSLKSGGLVLVLDGHTLKIVSSMFKRSELSDFGILFIEQLDKPRQPFPDLDVVYFVSCNRGAMEAILKDHKTPVCLYKYSHVFFSSGRLTDSLMDSLTGNREFVSRCKNLIEINLDFISFEPRVFTCDMPLAIRSIGANDDILVRHHIDSLLSLVASLKEKPVLRYMSPETSAAGSMASQRVALGLRREIDELSKSGSLEANGTTMLVLDRSIETSVLWMHDFFYQALALDILDGVDETGIKWSLGLGTSADDTVTEQAMSVVPWFEFKTKTGKGSEEVRKVILSESDPIYVRYRHEHFAYVLDQIRLELRSLVEKNEAARRLLGESSAKDPLEILRSIPEYQDLVAKLSVHLKLSESLAIAIEKLALKEVVKFEQELATGVDDDGREISVSKIFSNLSNLFKDSSAISPEERLRLTALYLTQIDGISDATAADLVKTIANLDGDFSKAIDRFLQLNLHGCVRAESLSHQPDGVMLPTNGRGSLLAPSVQSNRHSLKTLSKLAGKSKIKKNKNLAKNSKFVNCRFRSELADLIEMTLMNSLDLTAYPIVGGTGSSQYFVGAPKSPTETTTSGSLAAQWGQSAAVKSSVKQRIVVFVIGGITLGECRDIAEIEAKYDVEVYLGGSTILTPRRLVEILLR